VTTVYCATSNAGKLREFRRAAGKGVAIEPLPGLAAIPAPDEDGLTFEDNAIIKALAYGAHASEWLFAEDSGLEVDALDGEPGIYSARYAGPGATDEANSARVLKRLGDERDRAGRFVCVIALVRDGHLVKTFRGTVEGLILDAPRGTGGFGYDPIFYYEPFRCSFGETERDQKRAVSHRGVALRMLVDFLASEAAE